MQTEGFTRSAILGQYEQLLQETLLEEHLLSDCRMVCSAPLHDGGDASGVQVLEPLQSARVRLHITSGLHIDDCAYTEQ